MLVFMSSLVLAEGDITLDVIICQYGPNTNDWFLGTGMDGTNFAVKFEEANPGVKLNPEAVSWSDAYMVVSTRISNNNPPDVLNIDVFANCATEGLLMPVHQCIERIYYFHRAHFHTCQQAHQRGHYAVQLV